jgi:spermidine synthase
MKENRMQSDEEKHREQLTYVTSEHNDFVYLRRSGERAILGGMSRSDPNLLIFEFARVMMGFLPFRPDPERVLLIGLGPGGQAKYIHKNMPDVHLTALEIDPCMIRIARERFHVPEDGQTFEVIETDACDYLATRQNSYDIILSDAFEKGGLVPESVTTERFYRDCHRALRKGGIISINAMHWDTHQLTQQIDMLASIFLGGVILVPAVMYHNHILFCFRDPHGLEWQELERRAQELEQRYALGLPRLIEEMKIRARVL